MMLRGIKCYRSLGPAIHRALERLQVAHEAKGFHFYIVPHPKDPFAGYAIMAKGKDGAIAYCGRGKLP